jgi:DNA-binding MarR family transcriptional regulator
MKLAHQSADDFIAQAFDVERLFVDRVGVGALRPEAKLLLLINQQGTLSIKQAMSMSGLSHRGFYMLLNRLSSHDLIVITPDVHDKRVKKIGLADKANIAKLIMG